MIFGIRSERELVRQIQDNVAYRWFLGYGLRDKIFDASTLSQNRGRRFRPIDEASPCEATVANKIFDQILEQALKAKLIDGTILYSDSTIRKANASKGKFTREQISKTRAAYLDELEAAASKDREKHHKKAAETKRTYARNEQGTSLNHRPRQQLRRAQRSRTWLLLYRASHRRCQA